MEVTLMKGIILAAGRGTRLGAITCGIGGSGIGISKPLAPVYDKPTIYYPLTNLMSAGVREIMVIASPDNVGQFRDLLGDGKNIGITLTYAVQPKPRGIAEAFIIAKDFIGDDDVALIFGDNVFSGEHFNETLAQSTRPHGATVFATYVRRPQEFGVVTFDANGNAIALEEKPKHPTSNYAVVGVYFYDSSVVEVAQSITPSARGELEITDVNKVYLERGQLNVVTLDSDTHWHDTGNEIDLAKASDHVREHQGRTNTLLGSPEAMALKMGHITMEEFGALVSPTFRKSNYGKALMRLLPASMR